jgi:superfamily II DNA or RNA helicase
MTTQIKEIPFQAKAANEVAEKLRKERGVLIQAGTGVGKTYITAKAIKNIIDELEADPKVGGKSPIPVLWIAPAATIIQTRG